MSACRSAAAPLQDTRYVPREAPCVEEFTPWYGSGQGTKVADPRTYHTQHHPDCYTGRPWD
ncbi:hypothetical protein GCM10010211_55440 [Streptomyces albospinus]|uniref:Uncharacterized protein n=1 Tax=Streptomyces albospinus TaxID=285515 RepID=A0ABQ2VHQ9_9ACTN|nr:hypothetical protein GCM10010211_55440 [Streptomyces albospinus]